MPDDDMTGFNFKVPRNGVLTALTTVIVALGGTAGYNWKYGGDAGVVNAQAKLEDRVNGLERELVRRESAVQKIDEVFDRTTRLEERLKAADQQRIEAQMRNDAAHKEQSEWLRRIMSELQTQAR